MQECSQQKQRELDIKDILTRNDTTCQNGKKCLDFRLDIPTLKHKLSMWRHRKQLKIYLENSNLRVRRNKKRGIRVFLFWCMPVQREDDDSWTRSMTTLSREFERYYILRWAL